MITDLLYFLCSLCLICIASVIVTFCAIAILAMIKAAVKELRK